MDWKQAYWQFSLAVLVVVGVVSGDFLVRWRLAAIHSSADQDWIDEEPAAAEVFPPLGDLPPIDQYLTDSDVGRAVVSDNPGSGDLQYFPHATGTTSSLDDDREFVRRSEAGLDWDVAPTVAEEDLSSEQAAPRPQPLPASDAAAPLPATSHADAAARALIAKELPHAAADEQSIWLNELRGLPLETIRDVLRIRQRIGSQLWPRQDGLLAQDRPLAAPPAATPETPGTARISDQFMPPLEPTQGALMEARRVIANNIANARTPGFKRWRVLYEELPAARIVTFAAGPELQPTAAEAAVVTSQPLPVEHMTAIPGVRVSRMERVFSPGPVVETGQPLDVAIEGDGFFQVAEGNDVVFTRAGTFSISTDRRLVLASAERERPLHPPILIPETTSEVLVAPDGWVSVRTAESGEPQNVGRIELVRFANPAGLTSRGENLFAASPASGLPHTAADRAGALHQFHLEGSNVNIAAERAELKRIRRQLKAIRAALSPAADE